MPLPPHPNCKVPGFGCTYPQDYQDESPTANFKLQRSVRGENTYHSFQGHGLLTIIEAGIAKLNLGTEKMVVDYSAIQFLPAGTQCHLECLSPSLKVLTIDFSAAALQHCCADYKLKEKDFAPILKNQARWPKSNWINEVTHRYAFERSIAKEKSSLAARFCESELLKELFYSCRGDPKNKEEPYFVELPESLQRVLLHIERHLYDPIALEDLVAVAHTSKPTLVRMFRKHLAASPIRYVWHRRLDEADRLLMTGRYTIAQVAELTGFNDPSTFSETYKAHFGTPPSKRKML